MNKNYNRGRQKEYRIMNRLKLQGFEIITRSAGSHSAIDVIAFHRERKFILCIQAKTKSFSKKAIEKLADKYSWLNGKFEVAFGVE